jgi:NAD(P)-dependent dehydrogenase (short-subunit alcohol dehydrogenase family)
MDDLQQQTVAIVGATSGIGLAAARAAAARGARAVLLGRSRQRVDEAARSVGGTADGAVLDMLDRGSVDRAIAAIGPIDHLVLAAAGDELAWRARITELTDEQIERSLDKLRGYAYVTRAAAPHLRGRGSITLLSGVSALKPPVGFAILAATNAGVVSLGQVLAVELAPVRVNVVMPGVVDTPRHGDGRAAMKTWAESLPARHFGQPEDIAEAIVFLMRNPYMTGHTLVIDGGLTTG